MAVVKTDVVCRLPNGCTLYREDNGVGGHRYWSDEVGGGVCVWDTCLVDPSTLLAAMTEEARRHRDEVRSADPGTSVETLVEAATMASAKRGTLL